MIANYEQSTSAFIDCSHKLLPSEVFRAYVCLEPYSPSYMKWPPKAKPP